MNPITFPPDTASCLADHLGPWLMAPDILTQGLESIRAGLAKPIYHVPPVADSLAELAPAAAPVIAPDGQKPDESTVLQPDGIAVVQLSGIMMKARSKFGGTSTVSMRRELRALRADPAVRGVVIVAHSPGGHVAGTAELADDIAALAAAKPVYGYAADLAASAAYWSLSQTSRVAANRTALVGSIGVISVVYDASGAAERAGLKVHVIATGELKGAGTPGAEVTDQQLAYFQGIVDHLNTHFLEAVAAGRKVDAKTAKTWATGAVFPAAEALSLGLIDAVEPLDQTIAAMQEELARRGNHQAAAGPSASTPTKPAKEPPTMTAEEIAKAQAAAAQRLEELEAAFPDHPDFARAQWKAGADIATARAAHYPIVLAELAAAQAALAKAQADAAAALAKANAETEAARADFEELKAATAKKGSKAADDKRDKDTPADPIAAYDAKLAELRAAGDGCPQKTIADKHPELRAPYLAAINQPSGDDHDDHDDPEE